MRLKIQMQFYAVVNYSLESNSIKCYFRQFSSGPNTTWRKWVRWKGGKEGEGKRRGKEGEGRGGNEMIGEEREGEGRK